MLDTILVDGSRSMDVVVTAVYGPMISDIVVLVSSIFAATAVMGFGYMDSTGTLSPRLFTRSISISGS